MFIHHHHALKDHCAEFDCCRNEGIPSGGVYPIFIISPGIMASDRIFLSARSLL